MFVPPDPLVPRGAAGGVVGRRIPAATHCGEEHKPRRAARRSQRRDCDEPLVLESLADKPLCAACDRCPIPCCGPPERRPPLPGERHTIWRSAVQNATNPSEIVADAAKNRRSYSGRCATPPSTARPLEVSGLHHQPARHDWRRLAFGRLKHCRAWSGTWPAKPRGRRSQRGRLNRHFQPTPPSNRFSCQIVDGT